ncbi:DUF4136 domain-containing protein [Maribacter sp. TH_r10]|uniref:DUF4136 domain-containing protein n=1 Tax=Maribacter luteus TaxID=2594478 RepID=A0A6I2MFE6_9FLAO|nr:MULTISPECIES: DUF4136 domain-containing protein [Maribacter]MDV7138270.1 DUF4136 domain-containing protein [Maribacter sp. TH_r10]MRX62561.1 DUF4136 domain-containing protein [Maribacter luteus]|tara:strand:+ start:488 stop:1051 length:564 start_codon:yes stop_codon:yes gene_type:complete
MKTMKILALPIMALLFLSSCVSVRVLSDYDREADFNGYKSYAFYKTGIDKAHISDLDKKRILKAIDAELSSRGMVKSENPDVLVSIFTKEQEQVDVYNNYWGGGWGWSPYYWGGFGPGWGWNSPAVSTRTQGSLYIDLIDAQNKELVWQGKGVGSLNNTRDIEKKEARIKEFVYEILQQYPPGNTSK